jgi:hypothetical protein
MPNLLPGSLTRCALSALLPFCGLTATSSAQTLPPADAIAADSRLLEPRDELGELLYVGKAAAPDPKANKFTALLIPRSPLPNVEPELLNKLAEHVAANSVNPYLKFVTLTDLNASSVESKAGAAANGSLLDFSNNQTALNEAVSRGIALVVFVDLTHFNLRAATVSGAGGVSILSSRVALTLFNAAEGSRVKTIDRELKTRGFDAGDLTDKAFDTLAKDISTVAARWDVKECKIKFHEVEVHAKFDGVRFPVLDFSDATGVVRVNESALFVEGASVEIDGVFRGQAPCRANVAPGTHTLRVSREGAKPFEAKIQIQGSARYDALLVPSAEMEQKINSQLGLFERLKTMAMERGAKAEKSAAQTRAINTNTDIRYLNATTRSEVELTQSKATAEQKLADADQRRAVAEAVRAKPNGEAAKALAGAITTADKNLQESQAELVRLQREALVSFREHLITLSVKLYPEL